jgi:hypothetical protein
MMLHTEMTEFKQWQQPLQQRSNSAKIHQIQPLLVLLQAKHVLPGQAVDRSNHPSTP